MFDVKDTDFFELEEDDFDTVLGTDITFNGKIRFAKPFMIKGRVSGSIDATNDLVVDTDAEVKADINAERILIRGHVEGDVTGKKLVFVTASGTVIGDIESPQVVLEPGSVFSGKCTTTQPSAISQ